MTTELQSPTPQPQIWDSTLNPGTHRASVCVCVCLRVCVHSGTYCVYMHTHWCTKNCVYKQNMWKHIQELTHTHTYTHIMWLLAYPRWRVCGTAGCHWTWGSRLKPMQKTLSIPAINTHVTSFCCQRQTQKHTWMMRWGGVFVYSTDTLQAWDANRLESHQVD